MVLENFVVFEGIDGAGTTTQLNLLKERIQREAKNGFPPADRFMFTEEPAQTPVGAFIRDVLSGDVAVEPGTLAYLFAADRFEHIYGKDGIIAAHNARKAIICDRYFFSSLAYQGPICGAALPQKLNEDFPLPSLLFFFDIDVNIALSRIAHRKHKEIFETKAILQRTADEYKRIVERWQNHHESNMNIVRIDASLPSNEIHDIIWNALSALPILSGVDLFFAQ